MGKKSKSARHVKKMAEKRAAKAAKRALYESNAKSGKGKAKHKIESQINPLTNSHAMENCGNVGCKRCFPRTNTRTVGKKTYIVTSVASAS